VKDILLVIRLVRFHSGPSASRSHEEEEIRDDSLESSLQQSLNDMDKLDRIDLVEDVAP
jgi:hypothetical protein